MTEEELVALSIEALQALIRTAQKVLQNKIDAQQVAVSGEVIAIEAAAEAALDAKFPADKP